VVHRHRVLILIGTRPEAVKLAPVALELRDHPDLFDTRVVLSGQHAHLVRPVLEQFGLEADADLAVMTHSQSLSGLTARALEAVDGMLEQERPELLLVQGDTTTVFAGALAAFYRGIPVGHVEAGLRTGDLRQPFPEEFNRRAAAIVTQLHFAPTPRAQQTLLAEGVPAANVFITGNTVTDALRLTVATAKGEPEVTPLGRTEPRLLSGLVGTAGFVLVEVHRRENIPLGIAEVCEAVDHIVRAHGLHAVVSVHPNPKVREIVVPRLSSVDGVHLVEPTEYATFVQLVALARLALTDSGGLQEEAPSFGTPVVVARNHTERPEAVELGLSIVAGTQRDRLIAAADELLAREPARPAPGTTLPSPFGDGFAARRTREAIEHVLSDAARPADYVLGR
jgi:UDP-N-acetylglucosamine 2-epimerase (non-hydrolysing)